MKVFKVGRIKVWNEYLSFHLVLVLVLVLVLELEQCLRPSIMAY